MLSTWAKWRANRAFLKGNLKRAASLLSRSDGVLCDRRLSRKLVRALAARAERQMAAGNLAAAWSDLWMATPIAADQEQDDLSRRKNRLVELTIESADAYLQAGKITQALALIHELESRQILDWRADRIARTARLIQSADDAAARGQVRLTNEQLARARDLRPDLGLLDARQRANEHRRAQLKQLTRKLERALLATRWNEVDCLCNEILIIAPNHEVATAARRRLQEHRRREATTPVLIESDVREPEPAGDTAPAPGRFMLWIDSVGGFLVCPGAQNTIGSAVPETRVEIPISGDLRRHHARLRRIEGGYCLEPLSDSGQVLVGRKRIDQPTPLDNHQLIQLDGGIELVYHQPHPLSSSARLSFHSRHRTQPWSDGILLAAQSLLLGPDPRNHVWCPGWDRNVVLYHRDGQWHCRYEGRYRIDGRAVRGDAPFEINSRIEGATFSFSVESIDSSNSI